MSETPADAGDEPLLDAGGAPNEAGSPDTAPAPDRGCGVVRRIALPDVNPVVRVPGGFVQGPSSDGVDMTVRWLVVSDDGLRRAELSSAAGPSIELALLPLGSDPFMGLALRLSPMGAGGDEHVWAAALPTRGASSLHYLGPAYYRGTIQRGASVSLSGTRAVYVTGHVGVDNLHAFVIDEHGERVAASVSLMEQTSPLFTCLQVVPTQEGAAISFIDQSAGQSELKLFDLSQQAQVQASATLALRGSSCPFMQAAEDGIFVNVVDAPSSFDLRLLRGAELTPLATEAPPGEDAPRPLWLHQRGPDDLLFLLRVEGGGQRMARLKSGVWSPVEADLPPLGRVISAEPGRLFAMSAPSFEDEAELYEIACGDLDD